MKLTDMRRKDRRMESPEWILDFLAAAPVGTLATVEGGQPFLDSNIFVYDAAKHCLYMHTAHIGRTRTNVAGGGSEGAPVFFSVHEMGRLLPADEALEMSVEYAGVVIFGRARIVDAREEVRSAL